MAQSNSGHKTDLKYLKQVIGALIPSSMAELQQFYKEWAKNSPMDMEKIMGLIYQPALQKQVLADRSTRR